LQLSKQPQNDESSIKDVWDGSALRPLLVEDRFFSHNHLAFSMTTDGVPLFKSSTVSLWPVYLQILNLPPAIQMRGENILLCGLYVGPAKPNMKLLLQPLTEWFEKLSGVGMLLNTPIGQLTFQANRHL